MTPEYGPPADTRGSLLESAYCRRFAPTFDRAMPMKDKQLEKLMRQVQGKKIAVGLIVIGVEAIECGGLFVFSRQPRELR